MRSLLYRHLPRDPSNGKVVMLACVKGELHEVGARMGSGELSFDHHLVKPVKPDELGRLLTEL